MIFLIITVCFYLCLFVPLFGRMEACYSDYLRSMLEGLMLHVKLFVVGCALGLHVYAYLSFSDIL